MSQSVSPHEFNSHLRSLAAEHLPTLLVRVERDGRAPVPSIQQQMGTDPISKLATAIEKLADAIGREGFGG
jgi:hypothetical protein